MAAGNVLWNRPQRYRRRRPLPALVLVTGLAVTATIVWLNVLGSDGRSGAVVRCSPPSGPPSTVAGQPPTTLGQPLGQDALDSAVPMPPAQVLVRVVNGSQQRGQAAEATELLRQLGFSQVAPPGNDPLYAAFDLDCRAQIRFGEPGAAAARTLSLIEPCAELVKDQREDATVDLAIGNRFDDLRPRSEARRLLEHVTAWSLANPDAQGGLQANPNVQPDLDPAQLRAARAVRCD